MSEYRSCHRVIAGKSMRRENKTIAGPGSVKTAPEAHNAKLGRRQ